MKYNSVLIISEKEKKFIKELTNLTGREIYNKFGLKRFEKVISNKVRFLNGFSLEINLEVEEENDYPPIYSVLIDNEGRELAYSDNDDDYFVDWIFEIKKNDGGEDSYIVEIF